VGQGSRLGKGLENPDPEPESQPMPKANQNESHDKEMSAMKRIRTIC